MDTFRFMTGVAVCIIITASGFADPPPDSLKKGKQAVDAGRYDDAIALLTTVIQNDPKNAEAYYYRGIAYTQKDRNEDSINDFTEAIRLDPKFAKAYSNRGHSYSIKGDHKKALSDFNDAIRLDPKDENALWARGLAHYEFGDYAKSVADLKEGIKVEPKRVNCRYLLAFVLATCPDAKTRDGVKSVEYATEACKMTEWKFFMPLESLAAGYAEQGKFDHAVKWQKKAVELFADGDPMKEYAEGRQKVYEARKPLRYRSIIDWTTDQ